MLDNWMWGRVPEMARERDYELASPEAALDETGRRKGPLRQLLDVLASGFDSIKEDVENFDLLVSVDECPDEFLPFLAALFGFEFPYDLEPEQQRNYLRTIISMYRTKGTAWTLRLAAVRILGKGFDLVISDETRTSFQFDVVVTADADASTPQLEQKVVYLVKEYSPAGLVYTVTVRYYFTESIDTTTQADAHTTIEATAWRFNMTGHKLNDTAMTNDFGRVPLSI